MAVGLLGNLEYRLLGYYEKVNRLIVRTQPYSSIFHHQWIMDSLLLRFMRTQLRGIPKDSEILDIGCGSGPYWALRPDLKWIGLDVYKTSHSHFVITPEGTFPIQDNAIEFAICTQVLEHAENPQHTISEISRVLSPGGICILNMPFLYPFHGMPDDYRRWTTTELRNNFKDFQILTVGTIGGIGATMVTLWLNFCEYKLVQTTVGKIFKVLMTPVLWLQNATLNLIGIAIDKLDSTESFPTNTFIIVSKKITQK